MNKSALNQDVIFFLSALGTAVLFILGLTIVLQ